MTASSAAMLGLLGAIWALRRDPHLMLPALKLVAPVELHGALERAATGDNRAVAELAGWVERQGATLQ